MWDVGNITLIHFLNMVNVIDTLQSFTNLAVHANKFFCRPIGLHVGSVVMWFIDSVLCKRCLPFSTVAAGLAPKRRYSTSSTAPYVLLFWWEVSINSRKVNHSDVYLLNWSVPYFSWVTVVIAQVDTVGGLKTGHSFIACIIAFILWNQCICPSEDPPTRPQAYIAF